MSEPFVFGIPLIARCVADDWTRVDRLLGLTLRSVLAQGDADFHVVLAGHDLPASWRAVAEDRRFTFIRADWPPEPPSPANDDGGRKKWMIKRWMRDLGGGLLMFLDADDWIANDLVAQAREAFGPQDVGALVAHGCAVDFHSLHQAPFPIAGTFDGPIHGLCGSTTVARVAPDRGSPFHDPHGILGSHHEWPDNARRAGLRLASIDTQVAYVVGTGQNHSEAQGPFAAWRRQLTQAVRTHGHRLDPGTLRLFGQDQELRRPDVPDDEAS